MPHPSLHPNPILQNSQRCLNAQGLSLSFWKTLDAQQNYQIIPGPRLRPLLPRRQHLMLLVPRFLRPHNRQIILMRTSRRLCQRTMCGHQRDLGRICPRKAQRMGNLSMLGHRVTDHLPQPPRQQLTMRALVEGKPLQSRIWRLSAPNGPQLLRQHQGLPDSPRASTGRGVGPLRQANAIPAISVKLPSGDVAPTVQGRFATHAACIMPK